MSDCDCPPGFQHRRGCAIAYWPDEAKRETVVCPSCLREREVDSSQAWRIRSEQRSGLCLDCSYAARRPERIAEANARFAERFWSKVDKSGECWLWTAAKTSAGYGHLAVGSKTDGSRRHVLAHRVAYEFLVGPIPDGLFLDHVSARGCTSTLCVNPAHLEPVTNRENLLRGDNPAAVNARKAHCPHGHPYDAANTRLRKTGGRCCRACDRNAQRERRALVTGKPKP